MRKKQLLVRSAAIKAARSVDVVASTEAVDSYGTVLKGWDLERYQRAPVVLWNHDRIGLPIGSAENVRLEGGELRMSIRFVDAAANPIAEQVYQGVKQGAIRGVSVGFAPRSDIKVTMDEGAEVDTLDGLELLEVSLCAVPANPEAVVDPATVRVADPIEARAYAEAAACFGMDEASFRRSLRADARACAPGARVADAVEASAYAAAARCFGMDEASFRRLVGSAPLPVNRGRVFGDAVRLREVGSGTST